MEWPRTIEWQLVQHDDTPELHMAAYGPFTLYAEQENDGWRGSLETHQDGGAGFFVADDACHANVEDARWAATKLLRRVIEDAWLGALYAIFHQRGPLRR